MKERKKTIIGLLALAFTVAIATGCAKYEEGGLISKAEKSLTASAWKLNKYLRNGNDETSQLLISHFTESFASDGTITRSYIDKDEEPFNESGSWIFDNDKQQINITGVGSIEFTDQTTTISTSDYNIVKLTKGELWYSYENGGDLHQLQFVPN